MTPRTMTVLTAACLAAPTLAEDSKGTPPIKTWDLVVPGDKAPEKLPLAGTLRDNWDNPKYVRTGYLTTREQLADLWKALGQTGTVPDVDFAKQSVVLMQLEAKDPHIEERDGARLVVFKILGRTKGDPGRHYTLATFPKDAVEAVVKTNAKR